MESSRSQVHSKTIIHIGIDCFYAQAELLKRPHLQNEAVAVNQNNLVVTCNYIARNYGINRNMPVFEALKLCPQLFLFNGEDLIKYHQASNEIHLLLLSFSNRIEKSGLDENCLDLTEVVTERESKQTWEQKVVGHCEGDLRQNCACGCHQRLMIGSQIASEIRTKLLTELGFTSCCGISYNKVLAKVACFAHRPNQQTTLLPNGTLKFLQNLSEAEKIPRVGEKIKQDLDVVNVKSVNNLQEIDCKNLRKTRNKENGANKKNLSWGVYDSLLKQSGKVSLISIENGFKKMSVGRDVTARFKVLLQRLMILVERDGRMPMTIKVTVRNNSAGREIGNKETKQSPIPSCLFSGPPGKLTEESANKLLNIIMGLFCKMVNISKPFHITLLGLAFSKFHEKVDSHSVASFLLKKQHLSVQSLTNFVFNEVSVDVMNVTAPVCSESESDSDAEPSPKKKKLDMKSRAFSEKDVEMYSPSKLKVENLNLSEDLNFSKGDQDLVDATYFREFRKNLFKNVYSDIRGQVLAVPL